MDKSLTIDSLIFLIAINGVVGSSMLLASWTAPVWLPLGAIALGFIALQQVLDEDWFI